MANAFRHDVTTLASSEQHGVEVTDFSERPMAIEPAGSESGAIVWRFSVAAEGEKPFPVFVQHSLTRAGRALTAMTSKTYVRPYRGLLRDWMGISVRRIENELGEA